jgi:hypothetical protein
LTPPTIPKQTVVGAFLLPVRSSCYYVRLELCQLRPGSHVHRPCQPAVGVTHSTSRCLLSHTSRFLVGYTAPTLWCRYRVSGHVRVIGKFSPPDHWTLPLQRNRPRCRQSPKHERILAANVIKGAEHNSSAVHCVCYDSIHNPHLFSHRSTKLYLDPRPTQHVYPKPLCIA